MNIDREKLKQKIKPLLSLLSIALLLGALLFWLTNRRKLAEEKEKVKPTPTSVGFPTSIPSPTLSILPTPTLAPGEEEITPEDENLGYIRGQLIVKYKDEAAVSALESFGKSLGMMSQEKLFSDSEASKDPLLANVYLLKFPKDVDVEELVKRYQAQPQVEYAEPNLVVKGFFTPNDAGYGNQWGLPVIKAPEAWDIHQGNISAVVGICDTQVDDSHPDLSAKMTNGDGTTCADHGTHVAGIAAADTNNQIGVAGVGFNVGLAEFAALNCSGSGSSSMVANAITNAANTPRVKVINLSLGSYSSSSLMESAVNYAWNKGLVVVAAAGNSPGTSPLYPAWYQNVIAVAATTPNDSRASFSTYGSWVDVAAPGVSIFSTLPSSSYGSFDGTSMASPFVAGLAGLCFASNPSLTNAQVREYIETSTDPVNFTIAHGRINAYEALKKCAAELGPTPTPTPTPFPLVCPPEEWWCKDEDVLIPNVWCCQFSCKPYWVEPPPYDQCPTNKDWGQKDGTGQKEDYRRYFYYDYDLEKTIEVPPALPAQITPIPGPSPTCNPPSGWPAGVGRVTLTYRACHPTEGCHSGIDIVTSENKPVYSTLSGKVVFAGDSGGYGKTVIVECGGWKYAVGFSHLNSIRVQVGQEVTAGTTIIGTEGRTGRLTAPHLHYRVWENGNLTNPAPFIPYSGCVDWTQNNLGGGFCPGSNCTPQCPNTPACGKAQEQGQCAIAANLQKTLAGLVQKIGRFFTALIQEIRLV